MNLSPLDHVVFAGQVAVGVVFVMSAATKAREPSAFVRTVASYEVLPRRVATPIAKALIVVEAALAVMLMIGWMPEIALMVAAGLLLTMLYGVAINLRRGRTISCGCFGSASEPISWRTAERLLLLLAVVGAALVAQFAGASPPPLWDLPADVSTSEYVLVTWAFAAFVIVAGVWILTAREVAVLIPGRDRDQRGED